MKLALGAVFPEDLPGRGQIWCSTTGLWRRLASDQTPRDGWSVVNTVGGQSGEETKATCFFFLVCKLLVPVGASRDIYIMQSR